MSPRQWCALFCFYTAYLFFGASVFYYTEREYEVERRLLQLQERIEIHGMNTRGEDGNDYLIAAARRVAAAAARRL